MKNGTKAFLTVLITYISLCAAAWGSVAVSVFSGAGSALAIVAAAIVISIICSIVGVRLSKQPKSVWVSFSLTISFAWLMAILLGWITAPFPYSTAVNEIVNMCSIILGFPGFGFGMVLGEHYGISSMDFIGVLVYVLCGIVPSVVTVVVANRRKKV